ncbi:hypothetical protein PTKIN_Ptkin15bG0139700 [Pterospermum kingtungense]
MDVKIVSGSQSTLLCCSYPNLQASKSMLKPSSYYNIGFSSSKSSLSNPSFSLKSRFESFRTIPQASLSSFYVSPDIYCDVLGVSVNSSLSEIKQAYRKLVRKYHPDVSPPELKEEHTKIIIQVQEAYETLCDLKARALYYDQVLTPGLHGPRPRRDKEIFRQFVKFFFISISFNLA